MATQDIQLTVIIPILNESKTIEKIVQRVLDLDLSMQIIIVNDGSTDDTSDIIEKLSQKNGSIDIYHHDKNRGKGAAIQTAIPHIRGKYTVIQDGDLEYDPRDFIKLLEILVNKNIRVVYGSRILSHSRMSYLRYWLGGRGVTFFTNLIYGSKLTDEPTCYKMIESNLFKALKIESKGFEFCPEMTGKLLRMKEPIAEIPISYNPRTIEEGKKINWKDGFIALWVLLKNRFRKPLNTNI